jgi:hypothetical protein
MPICICKWSGVVDLVLHNPYCALFLASQTVIEARAIKIQSNPITRRGSTRYSSLDVSNMWCGPDRICDLSVLWVICICCWRFAPTIEATNTKHVPTGSSDSHIVHIPPGPRFSSVGQNRLILRVLGVCHPNEVVSVVTSGEIGRKVNK